MRLFKSIDRVTLYLAVIITISCLLFYTQNLLVLESNDIISIWLLTGNSRLETIIILLALTNFILIYNYTLIITIMLFGVDFDYFVRFAHLYSIIFININNALLFHSPTVKFGVNTFIALIFAIIYCMVIYNTKVYDINLELIRVTGITISSFIQSLQNNVALPSIILAVVFMVWFAKIAPRIFKGILESKVINNVNKFSGFFFRGIILIYVMFCKIKTIKFKFFKVIYYFIFVVIPISLLYIINSINYILLIILFIIYNFMLLIHMSYLYYLAFPDLVLRILHRLDEESALKLICSFHFCIETEVDGKLLKENWGAGAQYILIKGSVSRWAYLTREKYKRVNEFYEIEETETTKKVESALIAVQDHGTILSCKNYGRIVSEIIMNKEKISFEDELTLNVLEESEIEWNEEFLQIEKIWEFKVSEYKSWVNNGNLNKVNSVILFRTPQTFNILTRITLFY